MMRVWVFDRRFMNEWLIDFLQYECNELVYVIGQWGLGPAARKALDDASMICYVGKSEPPSEWAGLPVVWYRSAREAYERFTSS